MLSRQLRRDRAARANAEFEPLQGAVTVGPSGATFSTDEWDPWEKKDEQAPVVLWDNIDQEWTKPQTRDTLQFMLDMAIVRCSSCLFVASIPNLVQMHINQTKDTVQDHLGAKLIDYIAPGGQAGYSCSGCGGVYTARKRQGQRHLENVSQAIGRAHNDAKPIALRRYSLGPSGPVKGHQPEAGLQGLAVERSPRRTRPSRRRRRRGRR